MSETTFDRVRTVVAACFQMPESAVSLETSPLTVVAWDSMGHMTLVLALEQEFGNYIEPEDMERLLSVQDIVALLER
ncbi:MAG: acyl carrier protein [Candidatus Sericytochromatia bacterium]|nr:acyl carrier protein [Candidatus Sericytochromatia bacterium]